MKHVFFLTIFLICFCSHQQVQSQEIFYPEIEKLLSADQKFELEKAVNILLKARGNENNANDIERKFSKLKRKGKTTVWMTKTWEAKQQRIMAEKNYSIAYQNISKVYSELIAGGKYESSKIKSDALQLDVDAKSKLDEAESQFSKVEGLSREILEQTPNEELEGILGQTHASRLNALALQIEALEKIEGISEKTGSVSEDDIAWENAKNSNTIDAYYDYLNNNPRGKHMADANKFISEIEKKVREEEEKSTSGTSKSQDTKKTQQIQQLKAKYGNIVFKVQIAAAISEISPWMLKAKAPGVKNIENFKSGIWYKYLIGNFSSYDEAAAYRNEIRSHVPDAFIVVFSNGKQIPVTQEMKQ